MDDMGILYVLQYLHFQLSTSSIYTLTCESPFNYWPVLSDLLRADIFTIHDIRAKQSPQDRFQILQTLGFLLYDLLFFQGPHAAYAWYVVSDK